MLDLTSRCTYRNIQRYERAL
uniref:Uncharacterized protein n=1 Tax=Arundo donax TaxID=35708 RepID=A0A0A9F8L1_ARUDO